MFSRVAFVVAGALFAQSAFATTCSRNYTVSLGDTCDGISQSNNVSTYQLAVLNPNVDAGCTNLALGEPLCLGTDGSDCQKTYTVVSGDSCGAITDKYAINSTLLWANNPQLDAECSNLYIGEVVCVDDKYNVPPAPAASSTPSAATASSSSAAPSATAAPAGVEGAQRVASSAVVTSSYIAATTVSATKPTASAADSNDDDDLPWCAEGDDGW